jgi:hypothetical protein
VPEWLKGTGCKPVGIAYVGSNPTAPIPGSIELSTQIGAVFAFHLDTRNAARIAAAG